LHEFNIGGVKYADPDPDLAEELDHVDQKNVVLVKALGLHARCFDYLYDFGDSWHHVRISLHAGQGFHMMAGHDFIPCRATVSRQVGPAFHACRAGVSWPG
jgi:hypothetical protein